MKHIRRAILEALRDQLLTLTGYGGVWIRRIGPPRNVFPCITLYAENENVTTESVHPQPRPQDRSVTVAVTVWVRGTIDDERAESDMDTHALEIEQKLSKPTHADDIQLIATEFYVDEEEPEIHQLKLIYKIDYSSNEFSPAA
jgi:hypothetical protein